MTLDIRGIILHFVIGLVCGFIGGISLAIGFIAGIEITQAQYRSFSKGYHWSDLWKNPLIILKFLKADDGGYVDTVIDVLVTLAGATISVILCK